MKKIWKSTMLILGLGLLGSVIGASLPSCSNHTPESNYVGNDDGTNWKGRVSGWLNIEFNNSNDTCGIIQSNSFYYAENLIIPKKISHENRIYTLVSIGDWVFNADTKKSLYGSLTIPDSVTTIGEGAFSWCSGLTGTLNIPDSVTTIGAGAFYECTGLTGTLTIKSGVTSIGEAAFQRCQKLIGLTIGSAVTSIGYEAFYDCTGLTGTLNIPDSVTTIDERAFVNCQKLTGLTIGSAVTSIGREAFYECTGLTGTLTIPNSVVSIGEAAFGGCSGLIGTLAIPSSVTSIGQRAFGGCSFNDVNVSENNNHYGLATNVGDAHILVAKADGQCLKNYDSNDIINKLAFGQLTIPDSVTTIGAGAFYDCTGLTGTLTIKSGVTSIGLDAFQECNFNEVVNYSDSFVLINSNGITTDKLSKTNPGFMLVASDIPEETDADMNIQNVVFTFGDNITIPSSISGHNVISIGDPNNPDLDENYTAFGWSNIKTLKSNLVNEIYGRSFYNCRYLTEVDFPEVKKIHESAFEDARNLRKISLPKIESISHEAFEFDDSINWVGIDASRNPEAEGMNIEQIFGEHNSSTNGKLHNTSSDGTYKEQWLNKLCGGDDHHGWKWDN